MDRIRLADMLGARVLPSVHADSEGKFTQESRGRWHRDSKKSRL